MSGAKWRARGELCRAQLRQGQGQALAGVVAPGAGGVEADVVLPVLAGLEGGAEFVADEGEVVVRVGIAGIDADGDTQVAAGRFEMT
jgi:uncharacterized protein GlcG (DUF336 family)